MATLSIRNLDEDTKAALRIRAARHGRSMEEEARQILKHAVQSTISTGLGSRIHERFAAVGGAEPKLPLRALPRSLPDLFDTETLLVVTLPGVDVKEALNKSVFR